MKIITEINEERIRQYEKWGKQNYHPYKWLAILGEEVGEVNRAILESSLCQYREELIQVAAVTIAMIEALDRNEWEIKI